MSKRHCFVTQVGDAIEALASALDPEREPPFKGDILDLLEWAEKDVLAMRAEIATMKAEKLEAGNNQTIFMVRISELRQQLSAKQAEVDTAWAQTHRLALELECLIMDTKDNAVVSKWWDSAFEAIEEYNKLKPGAAEDAEAWAKMRKAGV